MKHEECENCQEFIRLMTELRKILNVPRGEDIRKHFPRIMAAVEYEARMEKR